MNDDPKDAVMITDVPGSSPFTPPADAPAWFLEHLQTPGESHFAPYAEGHVHYLTWNWASRGLPTLLLVHGFSGHARWWSFLAPFFTEHFRVAAIDLPGMGDSSHLAQYDDEAFARGILAVAEHHQLRDAILVGHSFGGAQTLRALQLAPHHFSRGVVIDTIIKLADESPMKLIEPRSEHRRRATRQECVQSFRMMPPQPLVVGALHDYIAYHSCRSDGQGWQWKFDPKLQNYGDIWGPDVLPHVATPVDLIYGELSMFNDNRRPQKLAELLGNPQSVTIVPKAHHHIMVDHPLELVAILQARLSAPLVEQPN